MLARVSWFSFSAWLPVDAWKTLESWQPWNELISSGTSAVSSVTFPSFLPSQPREAGMPRVALAPWRSFQAEQEAIRSW